MMEWERIVREIAADHNLSWDDLRSPCRDARHVTARLDCYRALRNRGWSYTRIGWAFNRHHATILYALKDSGGEHDRIAS